MTHNRPTNIGLRAVSLIAVAVLAVACLPFAAHAQTALPDPAAAAVVSDAVMAPAPVNAVPPELQNFVTSFIVKIASAHPVVAQTLAWIIGFIGFMRLWAKPLFSGLHAIVDMTPTTYDDGLFASIRKWLLTPGGAWLHFLLDYLCSIKIVPPNAKPNAVALAEAKATDEPKPV